LTALAPSSNGSRTVSRRILDSAWLYRFIAFAVFAGVWQIATLGSKNLLIPTFLETAIAFPQLLLDPVVWRAMLISNQALVIGFAIAIAVGVPIGLLMGRFRSAERFTNVYINIMLVTPVAALIPLMLMSVGIGLASRVIIVVLFSVTMVIVNSRAGVRQVDPALIEMARCFGATERDIWRRVLLPGALPAIMTGVRIGLGRAITGMVIVELLLVSVGLGNLVNRFSANFQPERLYALIIIIVLEALVLISLARWIERRAAPWARIAGFRE
jgi:ABC-type nitrate/sulfonate/bicarbonate transport system permease component